MPDPTEWRVLHRTMAVPVYENWQRIEKMLASKKGINLPEDKRSSAACSAYTALYECLSAHLMQLSDEEWRNF